MGLFEKRRLSEEEIKTKGIRNWPTWEKEVSRFPWTYDETEECYFIEGEVIIETKEGNYTIEPGDFVIFHEGLKCVWDIRRPVKKHYNFS
ncbi:MAG: uncharacterized protein PWR20_447 [Bacteroidales bacterium]|jgi:hypothetical protein|nr:uncharacterized protein [Bacteroidales bacterium]MDN5329009.1 uncharacterized protein [Bacteroidales bacterium]